MSQQALVIDNFQKDASLPLMPNRAVWTSHESGWSNIHAAHFRQPAWELPKFYNLQHIIIIPIAPHQTVNVEFVLEENRLLKMQYHPSDPLDGCIEIFPAHLCSKISWDKDIEHTHFYLEPAFVSQVAHEAIDPDRVELVFEPKKVDFLVYQICLALQADLQLGSGNGFYADSMATALSAHLLRHYATRKHTLREYEDGLPKDRLQKAFDYINENLGEDLSLKKIAAELNMSQYYFCRLFKQSTGMAPHQYLIQQRVERAKQLLKHTKQTVTDVAIECGFANQSHLAKHFRQYTGVTPKGFRKM
ncbi:helix-turn-helix domain-containing protein [Tolypothrix bouteillei VB521301_2]